METINIQDLKPSMMKLVKKVLSGQEIIIEENGQPVVKLSAVISEKVEAKPTGKREPGGWEGQLWLADDWDSKETNEEIARSFYEGEIFPKHEQ